MAPKPPKTEEKDEAPFQAVVVADAFDDSFSRFSQCKPRCLLPLLGHPLIDYTLDFLARSGVQEVYVYSTSFSEQLDSYLQNSIWKTPSSTSPFRRLVFFRSTSATSVGDVMRDLDQKAILTGDFVVVSGGDVVCDFSLEAALKRHQARRGADRNAIMTVVLREVGAASASSRKHHRRAPTFVIDPLRERCLHYEAPPLLPHTWGVNVDPDVLSHAEIDIRQDLVDCRIDICTPDVLGLWSDNFDNQSLRRDFLYGILKDYELNGKTVHTYLLKDSYAARVADEEAYVNIATDLRHGWCKPMGFDFDFQQSQEEEEYTSSLQEQENDYFSSQRPLSRTSSISSLSTDASGPSSLASPTQITFSPSHSRQHSLTAATSSTSAMTTMASNASTDDPSRNTQFHTEAVTTLLLRLAASADPSDIQVELMGLRFATNANESQVRRAVAVGVVRHLLATADDSGPPGGGLGESTKKFLARYKGLIQRDSSGDTSSQISFLDEIERELVRFPSGRGSKNRLPQQPSETDDASPQVLLAGKILLFLCKELYDQEVFGEEVFLSWWEGDSKKKNTTDLEEDEGGEGVERIDAENRHKVRQQTAQFIRWLREAESESDDDEEDDE